jgi:hypothetical protein
LVDNIKQVNEIVRGKRQPAREFHVEAAATMALVR